MQLFNSLSRQKEDFIPLNPPRVGIYTCGPTVYQSVHIGNFRSYILSDLLVRTLKYFGYQVTHVMNVTDVGHLTSDADTGEDKMEKGARRENKTAWEVAKHYETTFWQDYDKLNLTRPDISCRATEHISDQVILIQKLEQKGFTYKTSDGIYFDTAKFPNYGKLSTLDQIQAGARVEENPEKKSPRDFALWKFTPKNKTRDMEWDSPWGRGFPGWHIECSAMSMKYLGESFDIHLGGEDLVSTHHPNEIAQSEAATGKPFVKYWIHGAYLLVDGGKMSKSKQNIYTISDIENYHINPLALRYLYLTGHYQDQLNFTWDSLKSAAKALQNFQSLFHEWQSPANAPRTTLSVEKLDKADSFRAAFRNYLEDNLSLPQALTVAWSVAKSNLPPEDKRDLLLDFDEVLGLRFGQSLAPSEPPASVKKLAEEREAARQAKDFPAADSVRLKIESLGWLVEDTPQGPKLKPIS